MAVNSEFFKERGRDGGQERQANLQRSIKDRKKRIVVHDANTGRRPLYNYGKHGSKGFEWGTKKSVTLDTARSILVDFTGNFNIDEGIYTEFRDEFISKFPFNGSWKLSSGTIYVWLMKKGYY